MIQKKKLSLLVSELNLTNATKKKIQWLQAKIFTN